MAKRSDLQELRGIFIIQVLLFHFLPKYFPNGFVGVDQFFILSGYLISMVLHRELQSPLDVLKHFYYSRIKRILPLYYFFILISIISLFVIFPPANIDLNMDSVMPATLFYQNLKGKSPQKEYRAMLAIAEDIFTHTWSLCVEIQFYFLIPFFYLLKRKLSVRCGLLLILFIAFFSLFIHIVSQAEFAFSNVVSRIWQFFAGYTIYLIEKKSQRREDTVSFLEGSPVKRHDDNHDVGSSHELSLVLQKITCFSAVIMGFFPIPINSLVLRMNVTILIALTIFLGSNRPIFSCLTKFLVYTGDISYTLYLVHWPVYVYLHLNNQITFCYVMMGIQASFIISIIIHEIYEKRYLTLNRWGIFNLLIGLSLSIFLIFNNRHHLKALMYGPELEFGYEFPPNITTIKAMELNRNYLIGDYDNVFHKNCSYIDGPGPFNHCIIKGNDDMKEVLMTIGNSYAPNNIHPLYEYCNNRFKQIVMYSVPACEVLYETRLNGYSCAGQTERFVNETALYKPDVLIMYTRHLTIMPQVTPSLKQEQEAQETIESLLKAHEKNVKRKIYILHAMPRPSGDVTRLVNDALHFANSTSRYVIDMQNLEDAAFWKLTRRRLEKAVAKCSKCAFIDYLDTFMNSEGIFQFYDINTGVTYFNSGRHLTPYGLHKVRPIYKELCRNI